MNADLRFILQTLVDYYFNSLRIQERFYNDINR